MRKVAAWNEVEAKKELGRRREGAMKSRKKYEGQWEMNLQALQSADGLSVGTGPAVSINDFLSPNVEEQSADDSRIGVNYIFRYTRFRHSQLSANPPSVIARPRSSDPRDRRKADAGDRLCRWIRDQKKAQEHVDIMNLSTVTFGTGLLRQYWDDILGGIVDFDEATNQVELKGDSRMYSPSIFAVWLDPHAKHKDDIRFFFEDVIYTQEEAIFRWPEHERQIREKCKPRKQFSITKFFTQEEVEDDEPVLKVTHYVEKGLPVNGMAGRYAAMLCDEGEIEFLEGVTKNPFPDARLGLNILTDIDVDGEVYGDSPIKYAIPMQDMLNRMDSSSLDSIQAHNVVRMVMDAETDIEDESVTNSSWDWVKKSGQGGVTFAPVPQLMPDAWRLREQYVLALQDTFGINDSMMGIQRREQSAVSQQTSIEAGTMIHRRLFKKYEMVVSEIYSDHLAMIKVKWTTPRTIYVLGKEKAFEAVDIKGADIANGFDIVCEYGTSLPIDPNMRREALMLMQPLWEKAGMDPKLLLKHMKLNDLEAMYDRNEMAEDRQREIFEIMISKFLDGMPEYIAPKDLRDHAGMLTYAYDYVNTSEFNTLPQELQTLIEQHITEREQLAAAKAAPAPGQPQPAGIPGEDPAAAGGMPDMAAAPLL